MSQTILHRIKTYLLREKAIFLLPLIAIWLSLALAPYCTPFWDSGIYVNMGNSIAQGNGSKYLGYTFKYPPVFPFMLAMIILPFGYNFLLMRLLMVGCAVGSIWLAYLIVRDRSNRWLAAGVMVSSAFSFPVLFETTRILSELPYMLFSMLAIRWIERYAREADSWRSKAGYVAIGLIVVAYFTRIVGLTLFAGAIAYLAFGGKAVPRSRLNLKKVLAVGVMLLLVPTLWMVSNHLSGNKFPSDLRQGISYKKELFAITTGEPDVPLIRWGHLAERVVNNEAYYARLFSNIILGKQRRIPAKIKQPRDIPARIVTLMLFAGFLLCAVRQRSLIEYYMFFYILTYILWPANQMERFLVPIIPFLFYYVFRLLEQLVKGIQWILRRALQWEDRRRIVEVAAVILLTGMFVQFNWADNTRIIKYEKRAPYYSGRYGVFLKLTEWLVENTPDNTAVISSDPAFAQVLFEMQAPRNRTARRTFGFPWDAPEAVLNLIDRIPIDYIISVPSGRAREFLHPTLKKYPDRFEEIYRQRKYVIYRVVR